MTRPPALFVRNAGGTVPLMLGTQLGEGASGRVFAIAGKPTEAVKLYHDAREAARHAAKVERMLANPPDLPALVRGGQRYPQIAWPKRAVVDGGGRLVGFTMPMIDFARSTSLVNLLQKSSRRAEGLSEHYGYRVLVARNLAALFVELHRAGHHMIDMKPANMRFYPKVSWLAVVDADGFSIAGEDGRIPANQVSDDYVAPESWDRRPEELGIAQDLFALAVIVFQLLNNGVHPYSGMPVAGRAQPTDIQTRIRRGLYAYGNEQRDDIRPAAASIHRSFRRATRDLFDRAFHGGAGERPDAAAWRDHLDDLVRRLVPCATKPEEHAHFGAGCGFCAHEARIEAQAKIAVEKRRRAAQVAEQARAAAGRGVAHAGAGLPGARAGFHPYARLPVPRRARKRGPRWRLPAAALTGCALLAVLLLPREGDRYETPVAAAADTGGWFRTSPAPTPAAGPSVAYVVTPPEESDSIFMRAGPGLAYPVAGELGIAEIVQGRERKVARDGSTWVQVARVEDGAEGFVLERLLLPAASVRGETLASEACEGGCGGAEARVSAAAVEARFTVLDRQTDRVGQSYLSRARDEWRGWRTRCRIMSDPGSCMIQADVLRLDLLDEWQEADRERLTDPAALGGFAAPPPGTDT